MANIDKCGKISKSDQTDFISLYKYCHNFWTKSPNYTEQKSWKSQKYNLSYYY